MIERRDELLLQVVGKEFHKKVSELERTRGPGLISLYDVNNLLGFPVDEKKKTAKYSDLIRKKAKELGISGAGENHPLFFSLDAVRIGAAFNFGIISQEELADMAGFVKKKKYDRDYTFLLEEKTMTIRGLSRKEMELFKMLTETSKDNRYTLSFMTERLKKEWKKNNKEELEITRDSVGGTFYNLKRKAEDQGLAIVAQKVEGAEIRAADKVGYYLTSKNLYNRKEKLEETISIKDNIFEAKKPAEKNDLEFPIFDKLTLNKVFSMKGSKLETCGLKGLKMEKIVRVVNEKTEEIFLPPSLEDNEIYVVILGLLNMHTNKKEVLDAFSVKMEPLEREEIKRMLNRIRLKFEKSKSWDTETIRESILSAYDKLTAFVKYPEEYFNYCKDKTSAQSLLDCFDKTRLDESLFRELLFEQAVLPRAIIEETELVD
jgi:hypothetical protein